MTWPRIFHRVWLSEPERPEFAAWRDRLAELHPGWEIRTWQDPDALTWMRHYDLMRELLLTDPFGRAPDLLRYELLWKFGGCYIDTDFEPLRPMDALFDDPRPFAGWENDRTMCTALLAAPPKHPAIGVLLDGVVDRLDATKGLTANNAIGPEYATALWRERDDVRRLPPKVFYPVGWWERGLLGKVAYTDETLAVHHWAKGWDPKAAKPRADAKLSILVAFRDVDGTRTPLWDFVRAHLPEAEVIVASDDGDDPFHKTQAINRAAREATGDVFALWDADTWCDPVATIELAQRIQADPKVWGRPWNVKLKINEEATAHLLSLGEAWDGQFDQVAWRPHENRNTFPDAPPLLMHREAFETIGGADERFRGWHGEDVAMSLALKVLVGRQAAPGRTTALHLNHSRIGRSGDDLWHGQDSTYENRELVRAYRQARNPDRMRELVMGVSV